jgi:hypothetical protein
LRPLDGNVDSPAHSMGQIKSGWELFHVDCASGLAAG